METKLVFVMVLIIISLIGAITLVFLKTPQSSPKINLETCNAIKDSQGQHNIVFFSDKEQAEEYTDYFLSQSPFNSHKDQFNFYYISDYEPECKMYKGIAILCHSRELIKKAASCPSDYIVVLKDEKRSVRSSAYMNVMSLNINSPKSVFIHEFGHVFANLADEYVPASIPRGSENCKSSCEKFDVKDDCSQGCSKDSYFRSINAGVMRTLSSNNFGLFNEALILEEIDAKESSITGNTISEKTNCNSQQYYLITGIYEEDKLTILSKSLEQGCVSGNGAGAFNIELLDSQGNKIYSEDFNPELIFTDAPGQEQIEGQTFESDKEFYLKSPVISSANQLQITLDDEILTKQPLYDIGRRPCKK
ncbi:MAG: hypothetical protein U9Q06_03765 [Nanoarchaeota archaeon]|nr:hypothetical protein [Nanoarchaeota archaeon]